ncbi:hypothetical protein AURDEDRAFT_160201 [Auricularia subglabra TFB-10046 SS5]|nr:hypothetical protein AURDEDRAFT_160201 [Auricularia subglabra TFB-10046 SS5]
MAHTPVSCCARAPLHLLAPFGLARCDSVELFCRRILSRPPPPLLVVLPLLTLLAVDARMVALAPVLPAMSDKLVLGLLVAVKAELNALSVGATLSSSVYATLGAAPLLFLPNPSKMRSRAAWYAASRSLGDRRHRALLLRDALAVADVRGCGLAVGQAVQPPGIQLALHGFFTAFCPWIDNMQMPRLEEFGTVNLEDLSQLSTLLDHVAGSLGTLILEAIDEEDAFAQGTDVMETIRRLRRLRPNGSGLEPTRA